VASEQNQYLYEFGPFRLDAQKRLLLRDGEIVPLKPKAFDTLLVLVGNCGQVVEKDELMKRVWPNTAVEEGNLTFNISSLRKALGDDPRRHQYIVTIPGEGYQFVAGVRAMFDELVVHESTSITVEEEEEVGSESADTELLIAELTGKTLPEATRERTYGEDGSEKLSLNHQSTFSKQRSYLSARSLAVAGLIVVAAATGFGIYQLISQRTSRNKAAIPFSEINVSRHTTSGKIKHAAISPDGKYVAQVTVGTEGDSLWVSHVAAPSSVRIAGPAATEYVSVTFTPDGNSIYYLTLDRDKGHTALYRVPVLGGPSSMAAYDVGPVGFSPDGTQITFVRKQGDGSRLMVANPDGTNERTLATRRQPEFFRVDWNAPAWSPDAKMIACQVRLNDLRGQYETVVGLRIADGSQTPLTSKRWTYVGQPVWFRDGSGLLLTASESAAAPVQVWYISTENGEARRVTHDLNDYLDLSVTRDSGKLAAVQDHSVSNIWVAPEGETGQPRQIASEVGWIQEMAWTPDGRIVYRSNAGESSEIWVMNADGSNPKQLTADARVNHGLSVSADGRYIFFASDRAGQFNIWRADSDGNNLKQLTSGDGEFYPHSTPDGRWVVYQAGENEARLWKVPTEGGQPIQLTETRARGPAVSSDGKMIAYYYLDPEALRWRIGVVSSEGGPPLKRFDFPPTLTWRFVRWSPDRQSIAYASNPGGLSDIWVQPLNGDQPKRLTDLKAEQIIAFDWSSDGRSLAFIRNVETSDVVLISNAVLQ